MSIPSINMLEESCEKVDKTVQDMLDQGVIQYSQNPWASPIVLVAKQDGTTRLCVDYHKLNVVTKMDVFPLPRIDDLHIHYRPGKTNSNVDTLSCCTTVTTQISDSDVPWKVLAAVQADVQPVKEGEEETLSAKQLADPEIAEVITYLEDNVLPSNEQRARELTFTRAQYEVVDDVLYHIEPDKILRMVVPKVERKVVFDEAHSGVLGAHLREAKIHGQYYWWPCMRADITAWCQQCKTCATHHVGKVFKPPLTPIPIAGPFDRIGVDFIKFPMSKKGINTP